MIEPAAGASAKARLFLSGLAAWGPGVLVMLADTDAGNVVVAAQAGAQWNYRLLPLVFALVPALYLVQELAARLGLLTGEGFGALVRARFGKSAALVALAGLALATFGTLVTEFTGVAGIGALFGLSRTVTISAASLALLAVAASGTYRRAEMVALAVGLFECAFLVVAFKARPHPALVARDFLHAPLGDSGFLFLAASLVGSAFSPWMVFYQQAATARRGVGAGGLLAVRADTAFGAVLTQLLTGAVLVAVAASLYAGAHGRGLTSLGEIGDALADVLGRETGLLVFSLGVIGASFAAAVVASLALSWGVAEVFSAGRGAGVRLFDSARFLGLYAACLVAAAILAGSSNDLIWLNIVAQTGNALIFPIIVGLLIAAAARAVAPEFRLRGFRLALMIVLAASVGVIGAIGVAAAIL